jgi:hypothetical protein
MNNLEMAKLFLIRRVKYGNVYKTNTFYGRRNY